MENNKDTMRKLMESVKPLFEDDVYSQHGFDSRQEYLEDLADQYDVDMETVMTIAELYGPEEDFDGLVSALQDIGF